MTPEGRFAIATGVLLASVAGAAALVHRSRSFRGPSRSRRLRGPDDDGPLPIEPYPVYGPRRQSVAEMLDERAARAAQGPWVPAAGGTETPFRTRTGRRLQYCWQRSTGKHAYLDCDTDLILSDEEAQAVLGMRGPSRRRLSGPDDDDDSSRPAPRTPQVKSSGTALLLVDEPQSLDPLVPVVRPARRTEWFGGRVAELPTRKPHISPALLELTAEDE